MYGFSSKVQGLLQLLKEGEREEAMAKLDPSMAKKLEERRKKEKARPGQGGIKPQLDKEVDHRGSGEPEASTDPSTALLESAGKYYLQNNPEEVKYSEENE